MTEEINVPLSDLTRTQLARATFAAITRLESRMSDLDAATAELTQAVADIAARILPRIDQLETQLAAAQAGEAAALTDAAENVTAIRADVAELNTIGQPPAPAPTEPAPPETASADSHVAGHDVV